LVSLNFFTEISRFDETSKSHWRQDESPIALLVDEASGLCCVLAQLEAMGMDGWIWQHSWHRSKFIDVYRGWYQF